MKKWLLAIFLGAVIGTEVLFASMLLTRAMLEDDKYDQQSAIAEECA